MIEWILTGFNAAGWIILALIIGEFLVLISDLITIPILKYMGIIALITIPFIFPFLFASTSLNGSEWTTIYTKGDHLSINIELTQWHSKYVLESNTEIGSTFTDMDSLLNNTLSGTITATDSKGQVTYDVLLQKDNVIKNKKLNNHSQIVKVEYRKITSRQNHFGSYSGNPYPVDHDGELRITFDDGDNEVKQLFEPKN